MASDRRTRAMQRANRRRRDEPGAVHLPVSELYFDAYEAELAADLENEEVIGRAVDADNASWDRGGGTFASMRAALKSLLEER